MSAAETAQALRETVRPEQSSEEGKGRFFLAREHSEHESHVREEELFPFVQRGNCDAKTSANSDDGCIPLEIGAQDSEFEAETI